MLGLTIPSAVLKLVSQQLGDNCVHILIEIGAESDKHAVDAWLGFATEESFAGVFPSATLPHLRDGAANLVASGIDSELSQQHQCIGCGRPRLRFVPLPLPVRK